jgi:hypothetical protein
MKTHALSEPGTRRKPVVLARFNGLMYNHLLPGTTLDYRTKSNGSEAIVGGVVVAEGRQRDDSVVKEPRTAARHSRA